MTMTAIRGLVPLWMPFARTYQTGSGSASVSTFQLNGSGDKLAWIFTAGEDFTLDVVAFRSSVVTTGGNIDVTIEGVDATNGRPDGVPIGNTVQITTVSATPNTYQPTGFAAALTKGTPYAVVLTYSSGDSTFGHSYGTTIGMMPYTYTFDGTTHTVQAANQALLGIGTSLTNYLTYPGLAGPASNADATFTDAGATDEVGVVFTVEYPARLRGFLTSPQDVGTENYSFKAYATPLGTPAVLNTGGTDLTISRDINIRGTLTGGWEMLKFPTYYDLTPGVQYGITMRAGTAGTYAVGTYSYTDADLLACIAGGNNCSQIARANDTGTFTNTATGLVTIIPLFEGFDDGAGGGSTNRPSADRIMAGF